MADTSTTTMQKYVAAKALKYGRGYIGQNRQNARNQIAKFLAVYGLDFLDENGKPYAFCAAGACYCFMKAWLDLKGIQYTTDTIVSVMRANVGRFKAEMFHPSPSCSMLISDAKARDRWLGKSIVPKAGWLVFFDWDNSGTAEHVEIIESYTQDTIIDVGFNTSAENQSNGGAVAERVRLHKNILGYYATW